jgi:hypothetical protein
MEAGEAVAMQQYQQQLLDENETLIKTLEVMKKQLDIKIGKDQQRLIIIGERNQISALYEDHKQHYEALRQRLAQVERRLAEEAQARKDIEFS